MVCLECDYDIGEPGWGFVTCPQCSTRHKNHSLTGLTIQSLSPLELNHVDTIDEFVRVGNEVVLVKTPKPERLSYGSSSDPVFIGSHCAGCGVKLSTLTAITVRADRGTSLLSIPYTYQDVDESSPEVTLFNTIVVKRETTCWCCVDCSLKSCYRLYFSKGMDKPEENDNRGKWKGFNTKVTQGRHGRRV